MPEKRRTDRVPLSCHVKFKRHGDSPYEVDLLDLSPSGCRIEPPVHVQKGEEVWLRIPKMEPVHGHVVWVKEWTAGVEFDRPFYPSVFETVVNRLKGD